MFTKPISLWFQIIFSPLMLLATLAWSPMAGAQLLDNITLGNPKALGLAHAVTADPPGIDSIHFNPAGLAQIKGRQMQLKVLSAHFAFEETFGARNLDLSSDGIADSYEAISGQPYPDDPVENTTASTTTPALALPGAGLTELPFLAFPLAGVAIEDLENDFVFASAVYSPQAFGYVRDDQGSARWQGQELAVTRITYLSPSIAFNITDTLAIGASINMSWQGLGITTQLRAPEATLAFLNNFGNQLDEIGLEVLHTISPYDTVAELEVELEDTLSTGFNIGGLWTPYPWLSFGFVYRSESTSELEGDYRMTYTDQWLEMSQSPTVSLLSPILAAVNGGNRINGRRVESGKMTTELIFPQHAAFGTSIRLLPDLKMNVDFKWSDHQALESIDLKFDKSIDFLTLADLVYLLPISRSDGDNADPDLIRFKRNYESVWSWAIGFEYDYSDLLKLRWGYEPRESVVPKDRRDLLVPLADADLYTLGFEYRLAPYSTVDFALGYLHSAFEAPAGSSKNTNSAAAGNVVYNPYAYLDVASEINAYVMAFSWTTDF